MTSAVLVNTVSSKSLYHARKMQKIRHLGAIRLSLADESFVLYASDVRPRLTTAAGYIGIAIATRRRPRRRLDLLVERRYDKEL